MKHPINEFALALSITTTTGNALVEALQSVRSRVKSTEQSIQILSSIAGIEFKDDKIVMPRELWSRYQAIPSDRPLHDPQPVVTWTREGVSAALSVKIVSTPSAATAEYYMP